ncbi:uncharacterized protein (AIM24 family) [Motilibacter rhizosphaerae]|uniref:Uncharacterized protein (AIM24 family) n=1 Tax=Motilibacter rhizosphaerae TaxID=598652 RepID=A0A4Q7NSK0_9ACTN|nr:AIM24 family protein [Motilibacter rhizosphaerae]RZS90081.1 uncharacterized protein (AIM24 family) [Motilibacter rhizosphaerae]
MAYEKINSKVVKVQLGAPVVARKGAMLAYKGEVTFVPHGMPGGMGGMAGMAGMAGHGGGGFGGMAGQLLQRAAGEHVSMMEAVGQGEVWYGFRGQHVTVLELTGQQLQVEADRLLVHDSGLQSSTVQVGQGGVRGAISGMASGQGLFTTQLSGHGSVAVVSHGGTFAIEVDPSRHVAVDPQSYIAALGQLSVTVGAKVGWRDAVGRGSGEAIQLQVTGHGTVYVQASEQKP